MEQSSTRRVTPLDAIVQEPWCRCPQTTRLAHALAQVHHAVVAFLVLSADGTAKCSNLHQSSKTAHDRTGKAIGDDGNESSSTNSESFGSACKFCKEKNMYAMMSSQSWSTSPMTTEYNAQTYLMNVVACWCELNDRNSGILAWSYQSEFSRQVQWHCFTQTGWVEVGRHFLIVHWYWSSSCVTTSWLCHPWG